MADNYKIELGAIVNGSDLQSQINKLAKGLKDIDVKVDSSSLKQLSTAYSEVAKTGQKIETITAQIVNQQGQLVKTTQTYNSETGELLKNKTQLIQNTKLETDELKKHTQEINKQNQIYEKLKSLSAKNQLANETNRIKDANSLLEKQRTEYQSIWSINEKIATLNPTSNNNEIVSLQEQKKYHQENYLALQKQIGTYSDIISNEERINSLLAIQEKSKLNISNISAKQTDSSRLQMLKDEEEAYKINESLVQNEINLKKKLYLDEEQAYKINENMRIASEKKVQAEIQKTAKTSQDALNLKSNKNIFANQIDTFLNENTKKGMNQYKSQLLDIKNRIKDVDSIGLKNLRNEFKETTTEVRSFGLTGKGIFDQLKTNIGQFLNFFYGAGAVVTAISSVRTMVSNVYDLDTAMTSLRKVTSNTNLEYTNFLDNAITKSKELATSLATYVEQTAEWSKAGYNLVDSAKLAEASTIFQNVGDVDAPTSVSDIVTPLKAFNIEAKNAIEVVNKLNEVDNQFSVSASGIGDGLRNSASALALAGNDINQTIAMITGGSEITQKSDEMGTAIKILSLRLRGMKGELESIGEDFEDILPVSKIQTQVYNLTKGTVNIMDDLDPTKFKSTYEIIQGISKVWKDLSEVNQAQLLELISGKTRANDIGALIQSFQSGQAQKAYTTSLTSQNSAYREQEKWLNSLQAKTQQFQSTVEGLSSTMVDSNFLKGIVDTGTGAITVLTEIIDKLGMFPTLLSALGGGLSLKNIGLVQTSDTGLTTVFSQLFNQSKLAKTSIEEVSSSIENYNSNVRTGAVELDKFNKATPTNTMTSYLQSLNGAEASLEGYNTSLKATTASSIGLKVASFALNSAISLGAGLLLQVGISALTKYINAQQEAINKANELTNSYQESFNSITSNIDSLSGLQDEFTELSKGVDINGENVGLSADQYSRYKDIVQQVIDISPSLVKGYNDEGEAIVNNNTLLQDAINLQKTLNEQNLQEYLSKGDDIVKGAKNEISKIKGEIYKLSTTNWSGDGLYNVIWGSGDDSKNFDEFQSKLKNIGVDLNGIYGGQLDTLTNVVAHKEQVIALATEENNLSEEQKQKLSNQIDLIDVQLGKIDTANDKVKSLLFLWSSSSENQDWYSQIDPGFLDEFQSSLGQISSDSSMSIDEMEVATRNLGKAFLVLQDQIPTANIEELNNQLNNGDITSEEYNKSLKTQIDSIKSLADTYSKSDPILAAFLNLIAQSYTSFSDISKAIDTTTHSIKSLSDVITSLNDASTAMGSLDSAYAKLKSKEKIDMSDITALQKSFGDVDGFDKFIAVATSAKSVTSDVQNAFDNLVTTYINTSGVLDGLNDSNKDMITSQLELMGVTNAQAIVTEQLSQQKLILANTGIDVSNATVKEIISLLDETKASDDTRLALVDLATQKLGVNNVAISTSKDIQNLLSLMAVSNAACESLSLLEKIKSGEVKGYGINPEFLSNLTKKAQEEVDAFYKGLGGSNSNVTYSGGEKTRSDKEKKDKDDPYLDKFNAEKATLDHKLAMDEISEKTYYDKLEKLNNKYFKKHQKKYLEQYRQNQEEVYKGRKQLDEEAKDKAEKQAEEKFKAEQEHIDNVLGKFDSTLSDINDKASNTDDNNKKLSAYTKGLKTAGDEVSYLESQLAKLKKEYKDGKISQENYTEQLANLTDKLNEAKDTMESYQKSIVESIKAQQEAQTDLVTDAYDKEKEAIEDRYDTELDSLNKIIDAKKKSLEADKEAQDYAKQLEEKTKSVADIDERIIELTKAANSGDREAQAELKQLQEDRKKSQDELDELQADHKLSVEEDALDTLASDYQTQADKNKTIELDNAKSVYDDKIAKINSLYQREEELITHASEYTKKQFKASLEEINTQLADLGVNIPKGSTDSLVNSYNDLTGIDANGSNDAKILSILSNGKGKGLGTSELNKYISSNYGKQLSYSQMADVADLLGISGVTAKNIVGDNKKKDEILNKLKKSGFKTGGVVSVQGSSSSSLSELLSLIGEDTLVPVTNKERILTAQQNESFEKMINMMPSYLSSMKLLTPNVSNLVPSNNNSSPIINVTIPISGNADSNTVKQLNSSANNIAQQVAKAIIDVKRTR